MYQFYTWEVSLKKKWGIKQGDYRCKMEGAGFPSLAKLRAQMYAADGGNPRCLDRGLPQIK
jgi:hypothetical protein